jgi:hypothetical protein
MGFLSAAGCGQELGSNPFAPHHSRILRSLVNLFELILRDARCDEFPTLFPFRKRRPADFASGFAHSLKMGMSIAFPLLGYWRIEHLFHYVLEFHTA